MGLFSRLFTGSTSDDQLNIDNPEVVTNAEIDAISDYVPEQAPTDTPLDQDNGSNVPLTGVQPT